MKGKRAAGAEVLEEIWMLEHVCGITILSTDKDLGTFKTWLDAEIERGETR